MCASFKVEKWRIFSFAAVKCILKSALCVADLNEERRRSLLHKKGNKIKKHTRAAWCTFIKPRAPFQIVMPSCNNTKVFLSYSGLLWRAAAAHFASRFFWLSLLVTSRFCARDCFTRQPSQNQKCMCGINSGSLLWFMANDKRKWPSVCVCLCSGVPRTCVCVGCARMVYK